MLAAQGGICVICKGDKPHVSRKGPWRWCVDHDHATGHVRGILCHACNSALGLFGEDPQRLSAAIVYLTRAQEKTRVQVSSTLSPRGSRG
jgi:predicted dehydrogenase